MSTGNGKEFVQNLSMWYVVLIQKGMNKKKVIYDKDMDYSFTHNMRDDPY